MKLRISAAAALAILAGLAGVGSARAAEDTPTLIPSKSSQFPDRSYVLALPRSAELDTSTVQVVENGQPVNGLQIDLPGQTGSTTIGVVLLIDASLSMKGEPIKQAMAASRAFSANRATQEQMATILFNSKTRTLLPLSTSDGAIGAALAKRPQLAFGTHINDAVKEAADLLDRASIDIGSIVLLSDGRDVGSTLKVGAAVAAAKESRIRIFSVGLKSPSFSPATLKRLATGTGGTFTVASSPKDLAGIYSDLSSAISSQYLINYRSLAGPAQKVFVSVKVPGFTGTAITSYTSPGLPESVVVTKTWWDRFIQSTVALVLVIAFFSLLVGAAVYLIIHRRDVRFERRMSRFLRLSPEEQAELRRTDVAETLGEAKLARFHPSNAYKRLQDDVEFARITVPPAAIVAGAVMGGVLVGAVVAVVTSSVFGLLVGLVVPVIARWFVSFKLRRLRTEFAEQLPDNLDVVASALRAGHSLVGALNVTVDASSEPSKTELGRALADEQLGVPLDDALRVVARRMENRDLLQVAMVATLQREAGTNAAEVLERVSENVRAQMDLKRLVKTLTAQGRMARWIVSFLPLGLFLMLYLINKTYLAPLWQTTGGVAAMVVAGVMIVGGSLIIKKIVEIEV